MNVPGPGKRELPVVAELQTLKGQKQLTMLRCFSLDEAAGIDIASVPPQIPYDPRCRGAEAVNTGEHAAV